MPLKLSFVASTLKRRPRRIYKAKRAADRAKNTKIKLLKKYWLGRVLHHFKKSVFWSQKFREIALTIKDYSDDRETKESDRGSK